jgi:hypothetical protein
MSIAGEPVLPSTGIAPARGALPSEMLLYTSGQPLRQNQYILGIPNSAYSRNPQFNTSREIPSCNLDGEEIVQERLDVNTSEELVLFFFDEFGLVDASPVLLDSNGNFLSCTSSLWVASNSSSLSAVLVNKVHIDPCSPGN